MSALRKRRRGEGDVDEENEDNGMEIDNKAAGSGKAGMKSINDLSTQELEEARQISADKLRRILFADIEVVPDHKYNHINMNLDAAAIHTSSGNSSSAAATHPTSSCTSPAHHSPQHSPNNMQTHHQLRRPSPNHQQHSLVAASAFPSFTKSFQTIDNNMENSNFISSTHHLAHFLTPRRPDVRNRGSASTLFIGTTGVPSASGFSNEAFTFNLNTGGGMSGAPSLLPFSSSLSSSSSSSAPSKPQVQVRDNMVIPSFLYYTTNFILKHGGQQDASLFQRKGSAPKINFLKTAIQQKGICEAIGMLNNSSDCIEIGSVLLESLAHEQPLLPERLHPVIKGILSLNNASTNGKRLPSAGILQPTDSIVKLLRDVLLLFPVSSRHMIQWLVGFACRLARSAPSKGPIAAARQIATIFGPIIARSVTSANSRSENNGSSLAKGPEWAICMFELLIHAHGLLEGDEQRSALWKMNSTFLEEIQDRLTALLTPRRTAFLTPRRNAQRTARRAQTGGTSRRIGFISSSSSSCSTAITTAAAATIGSPKIDKKGGQLLPGQKSALSRCFFPIMSAPRNDSQDTNMTCDTIDNNNFCNIPNNNSNSNSPPNLNFVVTQNGKSFGSPSQEAQGLNRDRYSKRLRTF